MKNVWHLRGCDTAGEFDSLVGAIAAITTIDAAVNGYIEGPDGERRYADDLTRMRLGLPRR